MTRPLPLADELQRAWHEATLPEIVTATLKPIRDLHVAYPCPCGYMCGEFYCQECSMLHPCPHIVLCDEIRDVARRAVR